MAAASFQIPEVKILLHNPLDEFTHFSVIQDLPSHQAFLSSAPPGVPIFHVFLLYFLPLNPPLPSMCLCLIHCLSATDFHHPCSEVLGLTINPFSIPLVYLFPQTMGWFIWRVEQCLHTHAARSVITQGHPTPPMEHPLPNKQN